MDINGKSIGDYNAKYNVYTLDEDKNKGYHISSAGIIEVKIEGEGNKKVYTISNPTSIKITNAKDGKVYLMEGNKLYYKDTDGDDIYSHTILKDSEGNMIKSLTPIQLLQGGMRYTPKIDKKNKQIVIILNNVKQTFESSSGVAYTGIEYLETKDGKVYLWNINLGSYVDEKGKPVKDLSKAETSDQFTKTLTSWGLWLDKATYATSGYRGFSLFYDQQDVYGIMDNWFGDVVLGGIDGWTSEICKAKITNSLDEGIAMSPTTYGASAHIEGEKIKVINYSSETPTTSYIYKLSLEVNPGSKIDGCDMKFKVYIETPRKSVFKNSKTGLAYTFSIAKGNQSVAYKGPNMITKQSRYDYDRVCIHFDELESSCLAGIKEGEELCSNIIDGGEKEISLGEDPCRDYPILPNCWISGEAETTPSNYGNTETGMLERGDW